MGGRGLLSIFTGSALAVAALCFLGSCATGDENPAAAWITGEPESRLLATNSDVWKVIPDDRIVDLPAQLVQSAIDELGSQPAVALDRETFDRLTHNHPWPADPSLRPYLVRAVGVEDPFGGVHVLVNGNELLMEYQGPIESARRYRLPFVLLLPEPPSRVYVALNFYD
jgi:hypothetical protein